MKVIRWQGIVLFLIFALVFSIVWFFLLDGFIERMIEKTGTKIVGAKVDLDNVDVSFFPMGLTFKRLQVTNPKKPMTNAIDVKKGVFSLDTLNLLRRKVIIEDMAVQGVQFSAARERSGAILRQPVSPEEKEKEEQSTVSKLKLPKLSVPSVKEVLEMEDLETVKLIKSLRTDIQNEQKNWEKHLEELSDKEKFREYEDRIDDLTSKRKLTITTVFQGVEELKSLKKDVKQDLKNIKNAEKEFKNQLKIFKKRFHEVQNAPIGDIERLQQKYSLTTEGIKNMSEILFGPRVSDITQRILMWYKRLQPILERVKRAGGEEKEHYDVSKPIRGKGVNVHFKEYEPLPDFLVRALDASLHLEVGNIAGKVNNITPDQNITGIPLTFAFNGENLKAMKSLKFSGQIDRTDISLSKDAAVLLVREYKMKDIILSESKELPIVLKKALVDLKLHLKLKKEIIDSDLVADFRSTVFSIPVKSSGGSLTKVFISSLSSIKSFNLKVDAAGTLEDYKIRFSSSLNRVLRNAIGEEVKQQSARLKKELQAAINNKVKGPMRDLTKDMDVLDGIDSELTARFQQGNGLLQKIK